MGFLDKVKNLFTEEVEEPIVKKEKQKKVEPRREIQAQERKVEIAPARRETTALLDEEFVEEVKKDDKPLPIYFSDEDFADLEKQKKVEEKKETREMPELRGLYNGKKEEVKKEEKKSFRPSPIISPVYGILDKNYKKDDITTKEVPKSTYKSDKVTVDDIRNKAYGVLEDDLESNLLDSPIIVENSEETGLNIFEELETRESRNNKKDLLREDLEEKTDLSVELERQKQQIEEINEIIKNTISPDKEKVTSRKIDNILEELDEIEELIPTKETTDIEEDFKEEPVEEIKQEETEEILEDSYEEELEDYDDDYDDDYEEELEDDSEEIEENMNTSEEIEDNKDELEESDLFNLIDSMYEKRDE